MTNESGRASPLLGVGSAGNAASYISPRSYESLLCGTDSYDNLYTCTARYHGSVYVPRNGGFVKS